MNIVTPRVKRFGRTALSAGVLALAGQVPAAWAAPGDPLGPAFLVNTTTDGEQFGAKVAQNASGRRVVAWTSMSGPENDHTELLVQRYAADGSRIGGEIMVVSSDVHLGLDSPSVAIDAAGNFAVGWYQSDLPKRAVYRRYTADGQPAAGVVPIVNASYGPKLAMSADRDLVAVWNAQVTELGRTKIAIFAQRFAPDDSRVGAIERLDASDSTNHWMVGVAMAADGDFVVSWQTNASAGGVLGSQVIIIGGLRVDTYRVWTRHFNANGGARGPASTVVTTRFDTISLPPGGVQVGRGSIIGGTALAMDPDGDYVVAWTEYGSGTSPTNHVRYRRYHSDDSRTAIVTATNLATDVRDDYVGVGVDGAGNVVVAWTQDDWNANAHGIYYRRFDSANAPRAAARLVPATDVVGHYDPAVGIAPAGNFTIYMTSATAPGDDDFGVVGQTFEGP